VVRGIAIIWSYRPRLTALAADPVNYPVAPPVFQHLSRKLESIPFGALRLYLADREKEGRR
jgi:hypothetical protein